MKPTIGQFEKGDLVRFASQQRGGFNPQTDVATVLTKGMEVSEVKWVNGAVQIVTNYALIRVKPYPGKGATGACPGLQEREKNQPGLSKPRGRKTAQNRSAGRK